MLRPPCDNESAKSPVIHHIFCIPQSSLSDPLFINTIDNFTNNFDSQHLRSVCFYTSSTSSSSLFLYKKGLKVGEFKSQVDHFIQHTNTTKSTIVSVAKADSATSNINKNKGNMNTVNDKKTTNNIKSTVTAPRHPHPPPHP